ncbi:hypothetical protein FRC16_007621 [Serendipita sp. 398]|nr:hypothetical protein FRC16_007621 [Serendipita sp. 398]
MTEPPCIPCIEGKLTRAPHTKPATRASEPLQRVFSDVHGPVPVSGRRHERYWVIFIDDFSGHATVYVVQNKSDVFDCFKTYVAWASNQMKQKACALDDRSIRQSLMTLRDDKGGEYISNEFERFCSDHGIQREHTIRDTPQQNGRAERFNRFIVETLVSCLSLSKLPPSTWPDAVNSIVHVYNRTPSSLSNGKTPYELWTGVLPSLSMIRTWGCLAYIHLQPDQRDNSISSHAVQAVFVGYAMQYKGWKFVNLQTGKDVVTDSAVWLENEFPGKLRSSIIIPSPIPELNLFLPPQTKPDRQTPLVFASNSDRNTPLITTVDTVPNSVTPPVLPSPPFPPIIPQVSQAEVDAIEIDSDPLELDPPRLLFKAPNHPPIPVDVPLGDQPVAPLPVPDAGPPVPAERRIALDYTAYVNEESVPSDEEALATSETESHHFIPILDGPDYVLGVSDHLEPRSLKEATSRPDADQWFKAACDEIRSLAENGTWKLVQLPFGRSAVGSRWVFKAKRDSEGKIERYKGRLVARGYLQRSGIDYDETFAPTTSLTAIHSVMALAAFEDWELESVDVSTAFLNGHMDRKVYMKLPEGIRIEHNPNKHDEGSTEWVLETIKSIYGFKQAGNRWSAKLHEVLSSLGFVRTETDASTYIYERDGASLIVPIYVDDLTIAGRDKKVISQFKADLAKSFKIRDLGPTSFVLGLKVERDRTSRTLAISQCAYISDIIESYFADDARPNSSSRSLDFLNSASTPALPSSRLTNHDKPTVPVERDVKRAQEITGKLIYLQRGLRPDIAYSLHQICRFTSNPGPSVMGAIK